MSTAKAGPTRARGGDALVPDDWLAIEGLVCGFGDRLAIPPEGTLLLRRQVHGTDVVDATLLEGPFERSGDDGLPRVAADADALVAAGPGVTVGVRTADCVPLLLVAPRSGWAAAVHAGWKGTVAGIAHRAVAAARSAGIAPGELRAALGPSIGPCCYEVSSELGERFAAQGLPVVDRGPGMRPHLDLRAANLELLRRAGVPDLHIQTVGPCTRCARERYHSFRADPDSAGRQVSWIGWADRRPSRDRAPTR